MKKSIVHDAITIDNEIQHGKPVLKGTRIPVAVINYRFPRWWHDL